MGSAVIVVTSLGALGVGAAVVAVLTVWESVRRAKARGDAWQRRLAFRCGALLVAVVVVLVLLNPPA